MTKSELKITIDDDLAKSIKATIRKTNRLDILYQQKIKNSTGTLEDYKTYNQLMDELQDLQQILGMKLIARVENLPF